MPADQHNKPVDGWLRWGKKKGGPSRAPLLHTLNWNGRPFSSSHPASRSGLHRHGMPAPTHPPCSMGMSVCDSQSHPLPAQVGQRLFRMVSRVAEVARRFFRNMATLITPGEKTKTPRRGACGAFAESSG